MGLLNKLFTSSSASNAQNKYHLFVYGTLLGGAHNDMSQFLAKHSEYVGKGYFQGRLYQVDWYPAAILSDQSTDKVFGSVYKMTNVPYVLRVLDIYEGVDEGAFKRVLVDVNLDTKTTCNCWVYLYNQPTSNLKQILSGDFLNP